MTTALAKTSDQEVAETQDDGITQNEIKEFIAHYPTLTHLRDTQIRILVALAQNMMSDTKLTDADIARKIGVHYKTIQYNRNNPKFQAALSMIVKDTVRGHEDSIIARIDNAVDTKWEAGKFLLQYTGSHVDQRKNVNVNANLNINQQNLDAGDAVDAFLLNLLSTGWSPERIAERARELMTNTV